MLCAQPDVKTEELAVVNQHPLHRWWAAAVVGEADLVRVRVRVGLGLGLPLTVAEGLGLGLPLPVAVGSTRHAYHAQDARAQDHQDDNGDVVHQRRA